MELPNIGERRIFLHMPTGILLETVFREIANLLSNAIKYSSFADVILWVAERWGIVYRLRSKIMG
jgi:hypothetical protein